MKITSIECLPVHSGWRKNFVFVRVETDAGITGWGEAYSQYDRDRAVAAQVEELWTLTDDEIPIGGNLYPIAYFMLFVGSILISPIATLLSEIDIQNSIGRGLPREEAGGDRYVAPRLTPPEF
jgi:L-alanine-DL-glutamate epimerase-like enolase superfamily enzyme